MMFCDKNADGLITQSAAPETSEVTQENHYYPFGMQMESVWYNTPSVADNKNMYNGKEWNDDFGLNLNDYGARFYDPAIGRWHSFDPLAETTSSITPYNYTLNNPMRYIDPDGMSARNDDGSVTFQGYAGVDENGNVSGTTQGSDAKGQKGKTTEKPKTAVGIISYTADGTQDPTVTVIEQSMREAGIPIIDAVDTKGVAERLAEIAINKTITSIFILSHGSPTEASFSIGAIRYNSAEQILSDPNFEKIGAQYNAPQKLDRAVRLKKYNFTV